MDFRGLKRVSDKLQGDFRGISGNLQMFQRVFRKFRSLSDELRGNFRHVSEAFQGIPGGFQRIQVVSFRRFQSDSEGFRFQGEYRRTSKDFKGRQGLSDDPQRVHG